MKRLYLLLLSIPLIIPAAPPAMADSDLLGIGAGQYDIGDNDGAKEIRLEYRWDKPLAWVIEPWAGAEVTTDGAVFALGGLLADIQIGSGFTVTPSFGAGLYSHGGGKDLGSVLQFRSQLEMDWKFENDNRVGIAYSHISDGGLAEPNPGTQILNLYYHIPVNTGL